MTPELAAVAAIVFAAYAVQTVSGFGAVVITVGLGAQVLPIPVLLGLVLPLSFAQCGYIALRYRGSVNRRLLLREILPFMGAGVALGIVVRAHVEGRALVLAFAVFVIAVATRELVVRLRPGGDARTGLPAGARVPMLLCAGVLHGVYATGGPLLVYVVGRAALDKAAMRATLAVVWFTLNLALVVDFARLGTLTLDTAWLAPALLAGVVVGERIHDRVPQRGFELAVFALLAVAGVALLVTS